MAENLGRRAVYVVITAVLAVPVWYVISGNSSKAPPSTASLDVVPPAEAAVAGQVATPSSNAPAQPAAAQPNDPYIASMAPIARPAVAAPAAALALHFKGDSWVEISAPDGSTVEKALIRAGESRSFSAGQVGRMVLGNAADVEVQQASGNVDLAPYKRGNVARFTVSSDGSVAPVSH
ncbi:cytoskeletal protein RodZ [compost metagenome]